MPFFTNWIKPYKSKESIYKIIFQLLIISFPFGAKIFSYSLGFFTIYPYLLILGILVLFSFFFKHKRHSIFNKIALGYFFALLIYGIVLAFFTWKKEYTLFDLRNLVLLTTTIYILFRSEQIIGWKVLKHQLGDLFSLLFITFTIIAFFEYITGIHLSGYFTQILSESAVSSITYNPLFIYDNPNNFITYYILIGVLVILLCDKIRTNLGSSTLVLILIFTLSNLNNSRFGELSSIVILFEVIFIHYKSIKAYQIKHFISIQIIIFFALITYLSNPLYYGPMWQKSDKYIENGILLVQTEKPYLVLNNKSLDTCKNKNEIISAFKLYRENVNAHGSNAIRAKLIKNGVYLFSKSHGIGVGPGMYRYHHDNKQIPEDVGLQNGPHNWTIELISQFGIAGISYFILFLFMISWAFLTIRKQPKNSILFVSSTLVFFIISNSPSAFLLLDINWIFTGIILLFFSNEILNSQSIEN